MAAAFTLKTEGERAIEAQMAALVAAHGDITPLMDQFGQYLETSVKFRFEDEQAPDGSKWAPSRRARESGGKTLTDDGILKNSITHNASASSVEVGTNLVYAGIHNFGGTIRPKNGEFLTFRLPGGLGYRRMKSVTMPQRQFLGLSLDDEETLLAYAAEYDAAALGGAVEGRP